MNVFLPISLFELFLCGYIAAGITMFPFILLIVYFVSREFGQKFYMRHWLLALVCTFLWIFVLPAAWFMLLTFQKDKDIQNNDEQTPSYL